jgi:Glycoside-hydrolase family GH114
MLSWQISGLVAAACFAAMAGCSGAASPGGTSGGSSGATSGGALAEGGASSSGGGKSGSSGGSSSGIASSSSGSTSGSSGSGSSGSSGSGSSGSGSGSSGSGSSSGGSTSSSSGGTTSSSSGGSSSGGSGEGGGALWQPSASAPIHFHWMIGASTFTSADILPDQTGQAVYDIDGEGAAAADVAAIHAAGAIAVCYVDVGTLESGRSDYSQFPSSVVGPAVAGWPGENWLLVTAANQGTILPLMKARFQSWCLAKGFDAIEPDNLDAWTNISNVNETDNLAYDLAVGQLAHALPLSIGLKNLMTDLDASQYPQFLATFEWALNEQCYEYSECGAYTAAGSFLPAGKAVFDVEYNVSPTCADADSSHMNAQKTDLDLVGATDKGYSYAPCIPDSQATW